MREEVVVDVSLVTVPTIVEGLGVLTGVPVTVVDVPLVVCVPLVVSVSVVVIDEVVEWTDSGVVVEAVTSRVAVVLLMVSVRVPELDFELMGGAEVTRVTRVTRVTELVLALVLALVLELEQVQELAQLLVLALVLELALAQLLEVSVCWMLAVMALEPDLAEQPQRHYCPEWLPCLVVV